MQGISCGKGQCEEVMLKHTQADNQADVFKCVGCGNTVAGSNVEGSGPLDMEKQADDLYNHAFDVLQQQVCGMTQTPVLFTNLLAALVLLAIQVCSNGNRAAKTQATPKAAEDMLLNNTCLPAHWHPVWPKSHMSLLAELFCLFCSGE